MRPGIEKVLPFDPAGYIDQDPQRLSGAIKAVGQQCRKSGFERITFYVLCHLVDSFVGGKDCPKRAACCQGRNPVRRRRGDEREDREFTETMLH